MESAILKVSGMTCQHCVDRVQKALAAVPGTIAVIVDLDPPVAEIDYDDSRSNPQSLIDVVKEVGYDAEVSS